MTSLSADIARWALNFSLDDAPAHVVHNARLRLLDVVGVMLASGSHSTVRKTVLATADSDAGGTGAHSLVDPVETSPAGAAFINGVAAAVLEYDDTHIATNIHATCVVAAASLAVAQQLRLPGRELLEAVLVGSEIVCRLGQVAPIRMHELGFHPTSVYGVFAATYAVARLRQLSLAQTIDAVGAAGSLSGGLIASFQDGTSTKTLHVGFAASAAVRAAALARHGISGPAGVFDGRFGWYRSYIQNGATFNFDALTDELGTRWESLRIAPKLYPCAYTMMPFIAAALALREQHRIQPQDVREIRCEIMPRSFATICEPVEEKRRPLTSWHGRISLQHTVAEALALGRFDKDAYAPENLRNPMINALADKVVHLPDPIAAKDTSRSRGVVTVEFNDGRILTHTVEDMLGTERNPAPESVYLDKFRSNVRDALPTAAARDLEQQFLDIDRVADVEALFTALPR